VRGEQRASKQSTAADINARPDRHTQHMEPLGPALLA
jgi:hypothetical protein